jgi:hypothetical protein
MPSRTGLVTQDAGDSDEAVTDDVIGHVGRPGGDGAELLGEGQPTSKVTDPAVIDVECPSRADCTQVIRLSASASFRQCPDHL